MKKQIKNNFFISAGVLFFLFLSGIVFQHDFTPHYYFAVGFFFLIYIIQSLAIAKLGTTPSKFVLIYNFTTILKMLLSILFLTAYHTIFTKSTENIEKIYFSAFFIITYFIFLVINTKTFFNNPHEEASQSKSV